MKKIVSLSVIHILWNILIIIYEIAIAQKDQNHSAQAFFTIALVLISTFYITYFSIRLIKRKTDKDRIPLLFGYIAITVLSIINVLNDFEASWIVNSVLGILGICIYLINKDDVNYKVKRNSCTKIKHFFIILLSIVAVLIGDIDAIVNHNLSNTKKIYTIVLFVLLLIASAYYFIAANKKSGKYHSLIMFLSMAFHFSPWVAFPVLLFIINLIVLNNKKMNIFELATTNPDGD